MKVVIIGTGNVATVLGKKIRSAGYIISQVYGRSGAAANGLAGALETTACSAWRNLDLDADLYLVAIPDHALYELANHLRLQHQLIVHTAGSVSINVLKNVSPNHGVLYPLQSLRKEMEVLTEIPFLIHANTLSNQDMLWHFAKKFSPVVSITTDEERLRLHLAAVMVNNFTTHLYMLAKDYCDREHIDFKLLTPLIMETAERMRYIEPAMALTGPAVRNDSITIQQHKKLLEDQPDMLRLYDLLTESIRRYHKHSHKQG
jgi:predicted short-subunit dehydrogenase-like oxidoreductase (DUF2520 family)